jgi:UDP-4-amino-4-deoxy-L-arabinose formyltransferase/UDP-glucuronic acid dehydrogenase (UDP-4-keto-hexauronic acid decarboxylating)
MIRFSLIGEGRPARATLDLLLAAPNAVVDKLALTDPQTDALAQYARRRGVDVVDVKGFLTESAVPVASRDGWLISANSTSIIPADILRLFQGRSLNFHPGLLPQYAGLHTHQWAIRNGETEFGVTVHRMEAAIDTGGVVGQSRFPIRPEDTGLSLFSRCLSAGSELLAAVVSRLVAGEPLPDIPQDLTLRRLYRHRDALDPRIDWNGSAKGVVDFVRAGNYEPFASPTYTATLDVVEGYEIKVLRATGEEGAFDRDPGAVVDISEDGPLVACGDGNAVRIRKARRGSEVMNLEQWRDYVACLPAARLQGSAGR